MIGRRLINGRRRWGESFSLRELVRADPKTYLESAQETDGDEVHFISRTNFIRSMSRVSCRLVIGEGSRWLRREYLFPWPCPVKSENRSRITIENWWRWDCFRLLDILGWVRAERFVFGRRLINDRRRWGEIFSFHELVRSNRRIDLESAQKTDGVGVVSVTRTYFVRPMSRASCRGGIGQQSTRLMREHLFSWACTGRSEDSSRMSIENCWRWCWFYLPDILDSACVECFIFGRRLINDRRRWGESCSLHELGRADLKTDLESAWKRGGDGVLSVFQTHFVRPMSRVSCRGVIGQRSTRLMREMLSSWACPVTSQNRSRISIEK